MIDMNTDREQIKNKLKTLFSLAQEIEHLAESEENFISLINEVESELDEEEDYNLLDAEIFLCDCVAARKEGYESLVDYWDEY